MRGETRRGGSILTHAHKSGQTLHKTLGYVCPRLHYKSFPLRSGFEPQEEFRRSKRRPSEDPQSRRQLPPPLEENSRRARPAFVLQPAQTGAPGDARLHHHEKVHIPQTERRRADVQKDTAESSETNAGMRPMNASR